jgi:hypothetical protein
MRSRIVLGLLFFWLFALITPSVVTIIEKNQSTFVFNLNEEEQKETSSSASDLKHFTRQSQFSILLTIEATKRSGAYFLLTFPNPNREIILPPPEPVA